MRGRLTRFALLAGGVLVAESVAVLAFASDPDDAMGGDAGEYQRYAQNLVDHGVFSRAADAPYEPSIYRTPGYPAFLAVLRVLAGDSLLAVRVAQFALLGVLAYLVFAIAREVADARTGRVAALLCLTYLPFVWFARFHLSETLATTLVALVILVLLRARTAWHFGGAGVLVAAAGLVRPSFALAAVPIAIGVVVLSGGAPRVRALRAGAVLLGTALALAPWAARNAAVTEDFVPLSGGSGMSLLASAKQYDGAIGYRFDETGLRTLYASAAPVVRRAIAQARRERSDVALAVREELAVEDALEAEARRVIDRVGAGEVLGQVPRRELYLWGVADYAPRGSYDFWHPIAQVQHALLLVLALLGAVVLASRRTVGAWPVLVFPLYVAAAHLVVHAESRYSIPARSAVIVLGAIGLAQLVARMPWAAGQRSSSISSSASP